MKKWNIDVLLLNNIYVAFVALGPSCSFVHEGSVIPRTAACSFSVEIQQMNFIENISVKT